MTLQRILIMYCRGTTVVVFYFCQKYWKRGENMKFNKGVIKMQEQNPGYIILVRNGIFYTALGKDAVVLSEEFNQKQTCGGNNICKCGINIKNLEDFIEKLEEKNYKYIVYDYVQGEELSLEEQFIPILRKDEGIDVAETRKQFECEKCWYWNKKLEKQEQQKITNKNQLSLEDYFKEEQGEKKVPKKRNKSVELMGEYIKQYVISAIDYYIKGE